MPRGQKLGSKRPFYAKSTAPHMVATSPDQEIFLALNPHLKSTVSILFPKSRRRVRKCALCGEKGPEYRGEAAESTESFEWQLDHSCNDQQILRMAYWAQQPAGRILTRIAECPTRSQTERIWKAQAQRYIRDHWDDPVTQETLELSLQAAFEKDCQEDDAYRLETFRLQELRRKSQWPYGR